MSPVLAHGLLGASVLALGAAGLRAASAAVPAGPDRLLAAAAFAAAAAIAAALGLGLVGLGGNALALAAAAGATWLGVRALCPRPRVGVGAELADGWRAMTPSGRLAAGAAAGVLVAWSAWLLRYPALGYDMLLYHLSEAVMWARGGSPGSVEPVVDGLPVGYYPLAHEVLTSWVVSLSDGFPAAALMVPAVCALIAVSWWRLLAVLGADRLVAVLGAAALVTLPPAWALGRSGATLDAAALAWLGVCAALCAGSARRPVLLAPALVAGGLAAGTKTTALPLAVVALAAAAWAGRERLRQVARPLVAAAVLAGLVGGLWYARNLVAHGSPFWPYLDLPWGEPTPRAIEAASTSFLDRPGETLARVGDRYAGDHAGLMALLGAGLAAPLVARRREVAAAAALAAGSLLLWLSAPLTGVSANPGFDEGTANAVRYLLPGLGAAVVAIALAARTGGWPRRLAAGWLALATALNLVQGLGLGFPAAPSPALAALGALAGAVVAAVAGPVARAAGARRGRLRISGPAVAAGTALAVAAALAALAPGFLARHAAAGGFDSGLVAFFDARRADERPVAVSGAVHALLVGERLQRDVGLLPDATSCRQVESRRRDGWIVLARVLRERERGGLASCFGRERPAHLDPDYAVFAPRGGR